MTTLTAKLIGLSVLLCCLAAAACSSADTITTVPQPQAEPEDTAAPDTDPSPTSTTAEPPTEPPAEPQDPDNPDPTDTRPDPNTTTEPQNPNTDPGPNTTTEPQNPDTQPDPTSATDIQPPVPAADRLPADPEAPAGEWVAGINAAGWSFHRHLSGNAVSSPVSIGMAFSLSRAGASEDSGATLDDIFGFPEAGLHPAANAVDLMLAEASKESTTLEVANRLFPAVGFSLRPEFLKVAAGQYGAAVDPVDTADGAAAAATINRWVNERTRGLIPSIVDAGGVQDQELVLVNTVYLKADWAEPFLPEWTSDGQFHTGDNQSVTVPFMRDRVPVTRRFVRLGQADAVELPYRGGQLAMWLIVPHAPGGLEAVEESLDAAMLTGLRSTAQTGLVDLTMPKWEQTLPPTDLFGWLCPQGFCAGAGFDGIAGGIFITSALHGAKVIVDEKGTEAAAATAMAFAASGPPPADLTIVADRPFLWAIVHQETGAVLFVGRLSNPA